MPPRSKNRELTVVSTTYDNVAQRADVVCEDGSGGTETIAMAGPLKVFPVTGDKVSIAPDGTVTLNPVVDPNATDDTLGDDRMGAPEPQAPVNP